MYPHARSLARLSLVLALTACSTPSAPTDAAAPDAAEPIDAAEPVDAFVAPSAQPPESAGPNAPDGVGSVTLAISRIYLGDTRRDGTADAADGWRDYGFDLDHRASDATSTDLCRPAAAAPAASVYPDGTDGIDNSFGHNILPILIGISSNAGAMVNDALASGAPTQLLTIDALGTGSDYDPLAGRFALSATLEHTPRFDGTDIYDVDPASVSAGGTVDDALVTFDDAYLVGNTLVAHTSGTFSLSIGPVVVLPITNATIVVELDAAHRHGTHGTIAGVAATPAVAEAIRDVAGRFDPSLCSGPTIDSIVAQITQASDILADGTQDPTRTCDGISIGIGFDAEVVQLGTVADPVVIPDGCP